MTSTRITRSIKKLRNELETFLKNNEFARVEKLDRDYFILKPWNDESIALALTKKKSPLLIKELNNLILPPRFTAIFHLDKMTMEFIYTVLEKDDLCYQREFELKLAGKTYNCKFDRATERLLLLSNLFRRTKSESVTGYRNLLVLRDYTEDFRRGTVAAVSQLENIEPVSFHVSGFKSFDEDEIIEVSKHLNFYMQYYDRGCPFILIHSPEVEKDDKPVQLRFIETTFPRSISSKKQDEFLLDIYLATLQVESRMKFIYYYQILEYAAYYHVDDETRRFMLNIINTPDIHTNSDKAINRLIEVMSSNVRQEDEAKVQKLVKLTCYPDIIWKEIEKDKDYFVIKQDFDGGFVVDELISNDTTLDAFCAMWHPKTIDTIRHIRNALVHGREKKFGKVITPSARNDILINPWTGIIRRLAEQVIIYNR